MLKRKKRNHNIEDIQTEIEQWRAQKKEKVEVFLFPGEEEYLREHDVCIIPLYFELIDRNDTKAACCPKFVSTKYNCKKVKMFRLKKHDRDLLDKKGIEYRAIGFIVYL